MMVLAPLVLGPIDRLEAYQFRVRPSETTPGKGKDTSLTPFKIEF